MQSCSKKGSLKEQLAAEKKAQESQKFLAMLPYTGFPPAHAKEFQTLHVALHNTLPQPVVDQARPNCGR